MAIPVEEVGIETDQDQLSFHEIENEESIPVESTPDDTGELEAFYGEFFADAQELARNYIEDFFSDKEMYCGGKVSIDVLHSPSYITMILNTDVCNGVSAAYAMLAACDEIDCDAELGMVATDVRLVVSVLQQCSDRGIPKQFASGMLLIYLELCEGLESI
jgi:hypothetical protein